MNDTAFLAGATDDTGLKGKTQDGKMIENEYHDNLWHLGELFRFTAWKQDGLINTKKPETTGYDQYRHCGVRGVLTQMEQGGYPQAVIDGFKEKGGLPNFTRKLCCVWAGGLRNGCCKCHYRRRL